MGHFSGSFISSTLTGKRSISVDGTIFEIPESAVVARVRAGRSRTSRQTVVHVRDGGKVYVLTSAGMLDQSDEVRRRRAQPDSWNQIVAHSTRGVDTPQQRGSYVA